MEQHLVLFAFPPPGSHATKKQKEDAARIRSRAVLAWDSPEQSSAIFRKEDRRAILRELSNAGITAAEGSPLAALSLIVRKHGDDITALLADIARSLRPFAVHAILPTSRSIIALVTDAEALPALRKLHHDLFET
jgi:hypothetical protein